MNRVNRSRLVLICALLCVVVTVIGLALLSRGGGPAVAPTPAAESGQRDVDRPVVGVEPAGGERREREGAEVVEPAAVEADIPDSGSQGQTILLLVTDRADEPIAGARVLMPSESPPLEEVTGADGRCELRRTRSDGRHLVAIEAEGYGHSHLSSNVRDPVREYHVQLWPATVLHGRVLERGELTPVPGARLYFSGNQCSHCEQGAIWTDGEGRYQLPSVPTGYRSLIAIEVQDFPRNLCTIDPPQGVARWEQDFALDRGVPVQCEVVDFTTGLPVVEATIVAWGGVHGVDERGLFSGRIVPRGEIADITVRAGEYCLIHASYSRQDLEASETIRFRLPRGAVVELRLTGGEGEPISGARVRVREDRRKRIGRMRTGGEPSSPFDELPQEHRLMSGLGMGSARDEGSDVYRVSELVPWERDFVIEIEHEAYRDVELELDAVGGPGEVLLREVVLDGLAGGIGAVFGKVTLNGEPIHGWVSLGDCAQGHVTSTDSGGSYRFEGVAAGEIAIEAWSLHMMPSAAGGTSATATRELEPGGELRCDLDIELALETINGRVATLGGGPLVGVRVHAGRGGSNEWTDSGADGAYTLKVADLGRPYAVSALHAGLRVEQEGVLPGSRGIDLIFPDLGRFELRVVDAASGDSLSSYALYWRRAGEDDFKAQPRNQQTAPDPSGWSEFELPRGELELMVRATELGYRPGVATGVRVTEEGDGEGVEVSLEPGLGLILKLAPGLGPLPPDHYLYLLEEGELDAVRFTNEEGGLELEAGGVLPGSSIFEREVDFAWNAGGVQLQGLAPGRYRFVLAPDDLVIEPPLIELGEGPEQTIEVRWRYR